jgi:hypothetical protein
MSRQAGEQVHDVIANGCQDEYDSHSEQCDEQTVFHERLTALFSAPEICQETSDTQHQRHVCDPSSDRKPG